MKLYIGGLAYSVTDQELNDFFAKVGEVTEAVVIKDKFSGRSKGFGFVQMAKDEDAKSAIDQLNGQEINGRSIIVNEARPKEDKPYGGGDRGGSRSY